MRVDELDVIAGAAPFHRPAIIAKPADDVLRGHQPTLGHAVGSAKSCVDIHTILGASNGDPGGAIKGALSEKRA